ncbi:hypervirulence associated TUDOR domain-containing protein [Arthrobacter sp. Sr33]
MALTKGTSVEWNTPQGTTHGKIVEKKISDFQLDGNTHRASDDEPQYVVESDKTGAKAAHKASALTEKSA